MHMPIPACSPLRLRTLLQYGQNALKEGNHRTDTVRLGVHFKQRLLKVRIEGKGTRQTIRKLSRSGISFFRLRSRELHNLAMQLDRTFLFTCRRQIGLVAQIKHFGLKKRALLIHLKHFKTSLSFGKDVHAPVIIFLEDIDDLGRAADIYESFLLGAHNAKRSFLSKALADHFFVARLEDVEWQGRAGKQYDVERKKRQLRVHAPDCTPRLTCTFRAGYKPRMASNTGQTLAGKVAVITGASMGIGEEIAKLLVEKI